MLERFMKMLHQHSDPNLRFLKDRINFNDHYRMFVSLRLCHQIIFSLSHSLPTRLFSCNTLPSFSFLSSLSPLRFLSCLSGVLMFMIQSRMCSVYMVKQVQGISIDKNCTCPKHEYFRDVI